MATTFNYSTKSKRFYNKKTGRFVSRIDKRRELDGIIDKSANRVSFFSRELTRGQITIAQWQNAMALELKPLHISFVAAANGGFGNMSENDWERAQNYIKSQFNYLSKFADEIFTGKQLLDGSLSSRAVLYAEASRTTYEAEIRRLEINSGATEEMNILGGKDHCGGCIEATNKGWVPIGTLTPIGERDCVSRCRCNMEYRTSNSNNNVLDF